MKVVAFIASLLVVLPGSAREGARSREYWSAIVESDYAVPEGESAAALVEELSEYLGSPDPELRDAFAYAIPAHFIHRDKRLSAEQLAGLREKWCANLQVGIGDVGTDSVLLRSFSALNLSLIAAHDNREKSLDEAGYRALLDAAIGYLGAEKDLRGYVPVKGWHHATAHTADLLKFLARNERLTVADQGRIIDAIAARMETAPDVFTHGEDERLARALASLVRRPDFADARLTAFTGRVVTANQTLWEPKELDRTSYTRVQNAKNLLRALYVVLALETEPSAALTATRESLLAVLGKL